MVHTRPPHQAWLKVRALLHQPKPKPVSPAFCNGQQIEPYQCNSGQSGQMLHTDLITWSLIFSSTREKKKKFMCLVAVCS